MNRFEAGVYYTAVLLLFFVSVQGGAPLLQVIVEDLDTMLFLAVRALVG